MSTPAERLRERLDEIVIEALSQQDDYAKHREVPTVADFVPEPNSESVVRELTHAICEEAGITEDVARDMADLEDYAENCDCFRCMELRGWLSLLEVSRGK